MVKEGGHTEWKEVLCNYQVTTELIYQIQDQLINLGYEPGPRDNVFNIKIKKALNKFQLGNNLPIGQLDFETLETLGIEVE